MSYKKEDNQDIETQLSLSFKEHRIFFDKFYELRALYIIAFSKAEFDNDQIIQAYSLLKALIRWTSSQLKKAGDYKKVLELEKEIYNIISEKPKTALSKIDVLWEKIADHHSEAELTPKVNKEEDETASLDDRTRDALAAYKIIYDK